MTYLTVLMAVLLCGCAAQKPIVPVWHSPDTYFTPDAACKAGFHKTDWHNPGYPYYIECAPDVERPDKWVGPWPQGIDCGVPVKFTDGSEWIFPCWPEKNIPRCIKGCKP